MYDDRVQFCVAFSEQNTYNICVLSSLDRGSKLRCVLAVIKLRMDMEARNRQSEAQKILTCGDSTNTRNIPPHPSYNIGVVASITGYKVRGRWFESPPARASSNY